MSLDFDTCLRCDGYIIEGTLRTNRTLSSMCRCKRDDEGVLTIPFERQSWTGDESDTEGRWAA
jgi:hypothetical protein